MNYIFLLKQNKNKQTKEIFVTQELGEYTR